MAEEEFISEGQNILTVYFKGREIRCLSWRTDRGLQSSDLGKEKLLSSVALIDLLQPEGCAHSMEKPKAPCCCHPWLYLTVSQSSRPEVSVRLSVRSLRAALGAARGSFWGCPLGGLWAEQPHGAL